MIPNPILDCSYVVFNFWPSLSLVVLVKLFLQRKVCMVFVQPYSPSKRIFHCENELLLFGKNCSIFIFMKVRKTVKIKNISAD